MKNKYYIHGTDELIDLKEESKIIIGDWSKIHSVKYPEAVTYHEIYTREDYFKGDCSILPGDVVVDCGGNIGIFSAFAIDNGASRVLSYEPFPKNYILNRKNNSTAEVFNLAVSNKNNETVELLCTESGNGGHTIVESELDRQPEHYQHNNIFIKTITLDEIISTNNIEHIDFLKIDTEGSELMILEGLSDENLDKIRCISLEYHHNVFNFDDKIYDNFQNRFLKRGFNVFTWILDNNTRMTYICKGDIFKENPKHI